MLRPNAAHGLLIHHIRRRTTANRTPLNAWSARRIHLYLTTHKLTGDRHLCPKRDSKPTISVFERPQTYAFDRAATGTVPPLVKHWNGMRKISESSDMKREENTCTQTGQELNWWFGSNQNNINIPRPTADGKRDCLSITMLRLQTQTHRQQVYDCRRRQRYGPNLPPFC